MTPILIFFSWAWAEAAIPNAAIAATSPTVRRAALRTGILTSLELCIASFLFLAPYHTGSAARCQDKQTGRRDGGTSLLEKQSVTSRHTCAHRSAQSSDVKHRMIAQHSH